MSDYSYMHVHGGDFAEWRIVKLGTATAQNAWEDEDRIRHPFSEADWDQQEPPEPVRTEYERLLGDNRPGPVVNIVEFIATDANFNQPCAFGCLADGHAVYCHNTEWLYAPRKCRRTWYSGGEIRDEDCKGYKPNPQAQHSTISTT